MGIMKKNQTKIVESKNTANEILKYSRRNNHCGGPVVKNLPATAGVMGWVPGLGRFHNLQGN